VLARVPGVAALPVGLHGCGLGGPRRETFLSRSLKGNTVGSVIKKRRKRMAKKKHRKLLKRTRVQRRRLGK
jgi:hypothetical protein